MKRSKYTLSLLTGFLLIIACAAAGQAQNQRTYVAGPGIGNDGNAASPNFCGFATPCRNFAAAYGVTNVGGEIVAKDSVGYGGVNISHAVTITTAPGQTAFVAVCASCTGIAVSAGSTELVVLQNININGAGNASSTGLQHSSGRLIVNNCVFENLTTGINVTNAKMDLINSNLHNNGTAVNVTGTGTESSPPFTVAAVAQVRINGGNITFNTLGLQQNSPGFNANANNLFSIFVYTFANTGNVNLAGNTTAFACTGPNSGSPSFNPCQAQPASYNLTTQIK